MDSLMVSLKETPESFCTWFDKNLMKSNADKCHLLFNSNRKVKIKIDSHEIADTKREELLGVHLDSQLSLDWHVSEICKKGSRKVRTNAFSSHSLTIVHEFGCAIAARTTIKSIGLMKWV